MIVVVRSANQRWIAERSTTIRPANTPTSSARTWPIRKLSPTSNRNPKPSPAGESSICKNSFKVDRRNSTAIRRPTRQQNLRKSPVCLPHRSALAFRTRSRLGCTVHRTERRDCLLSRRRYCRLLTIDKPRSAECFSSSSSNRCSNASDLTHDSRTDHRPDSR